MKIALFIDWLMRIILNQSALGEDANTEVVAKLIWRDSDGFVIKTQYAEIGNLGSAMGVYVTIEMNTARNEYGQSM